MPSARHPGRSIHASALYSGAIKCAVAAILLCSAPFIDAIAAQQIQQPSTELPRVTAVRIFTTVGADIIARSDGWVELRPRWPYSRPNIWINTPALVPSDTDPGAEAQKSSRRSLFTPNEIDQWLLEARRIVGLSDADTARFVMASDTMRGINLAVSRIGGHVAIVEARDVKSCNQSPPAFSHIVRDSADGFLAALDSAAGVARQIRSSPASYSPDQIFNESEVSCAPTSVNPRIVPVVPPGVPVRRRPTSMVFEFLVSAGGIVDTSSVRTFSFVHPDLIVSAKRAMAQWRFFPAAQGASPVAIRMMRTVQFDDPRLQRELTVGGYPGMGPLKVRADGWIEITSRYDPALDARVISDAMSIRKWLAEVSAAGRAARSEQPVRSRCTSTEPLCVIPTPQWTASLGSPRNSELHVSFIQNVSGAGPLVTRNVLRMTSCSRSPNGITNALSDSVLIAAFTGVADLAERRGAPALPNASTIYEPGETGCLAAPLDYFPWIAFQNRVARVHGINRDVTVSFVVDTAGRVERNSVELLGAVSRSLADSLLSQLSDIRFRPAYLGEHVLRQRVYAFIAGRSVAPAAPSLTRSVCVASERGAVRISAIDTAARADERDLMLLGYDFLNGYSRSLTTAYRLWLDWSGLAVFLQIPRPAAAGPPLQWSSLPNGANAMQLHPNFERAPLGLEVIFLQSCVTR